MQREDSSAQGERHFKAQSNQCSEAFSFGNGDMAVGQGALRGSGARGPSAEDGSGRVCKRDSQKVEPRLSMPVGLWDSSCCRGDQADPVHAPG